MGSLHFAGNHALSSTAAFFTPAYYLCFGVDSCEHAAEPVRLRALRSEPGMCLGWRLAMLQTRHRPVEILVATYSCV